MAGFIEGLQIANEVAKTCVNSNIFSESFKLENNKDVKSSSLFMPKFAEGIKNTVISTKEVADKKLSEIKVYEEANLEKAYINGKKCYIKSDIDPFLVVENGKTNLDLMREGKAPYYHDGKKINLHHYGQKNDACLIELSDTEHKTHDSKLHDKQKKSEIERTDFNKEREQHWKARAAQIEASLYK